MITTTIKKSKEVETEFPKLMKSINSSLIVLFTDEESGTVVARGNSRDIGYVGANWYHKGFENFNDELILKND